MDIRDFESAIESLRNLQAMNDSLEHVTKFINRELEDVIYESERAYDRICELQEENENLNEQIDDLKVGESA